MSFNDDVSRLRDIGLSIRDEWRSNGVQQKDGSFIIRMAEKMTTNIGYDDKLTVKTSSCPYCGADHKGTRCHRIKSEEYYQDGTLKRVEFFAPNSIN